MASQAGRHRKTFVKLEGVRFSLQVVICSIKWLRKVPMDKKQPKLDFFTKGEGGPKYIQSFQETFG